MGVQIVISLTAVISGLVFARNARFQQEADIGYDRHGVIGMRIDGEQDYRKLADELRLDPRVRMVAGSPEHIGYRMLAAEFESQGENYEALRLRAGAEYLDLMGVKLAAGRSFTAERGADSLAVIVNEKLVEEFNWAEPLGRQLRFDSATYTVIGVVRNFIQSDFFEPVRPVFFTLGTLDDYNFLVLRTSPAEALAVHQALKSTWNGLFPYQPFSGFFQEEAISEDLSVTNNVKWTFLFLAMVMVLLSATGLFALVSLNVLKRMKEIALRRVVGASPKDIALLINGNYVWIFVAAAIAGSFGGAYLASKLLSSIFAIYSDTGVLLFILSALGIFVIGGLTVWARLFSVLRINPATVLKSE